VGAGHLERRVILGTAGHIDHGKTALVRALTGVDTDRLPEEKRRGITIDLGFAPLELDGVGTVGIVDVPGHENFVRTMLAGASGIDLAMLVVAADEGVMPQTREHLEILSLLRIPRGVIALTKCDLVDAEWRQLVEEDVVALCIGTPLENADVVFVSSVTGEGIEQLKRSISSAARESRQARSRDDLFRMPVDRAFTIKGTGTVVTGTIWSGTIHRDAIVRIQPGGKSFRVRGIQSHGRDEDAAYPGTRTAIALANCDLDDVTRGSVVVAEEAWVPSDELEVSVSFGDPDYTPTPRSRVRVHVGTGESGARFSRLRTDASGRILARLVLEDALIARGGDRFVIRIPSPPRTIGGGEILDPYPPRRTRKTDAAITTEDAPRDRLGALLDFAGNTGVEMSVLPIRTGLSPVAVGDAVQSVSGVSVNGTVWSEATVERLERFAESFIAIEMANHPLESGVSLQTLRAAAKAPAGVMDIALDRLVKKGRAELNGSMARPSGWVSRLGEREQALSDAILHEICIHEAEPPSVSELEAKFGGSTSALLRRLEREGDVERVADDRYYGSQAVTRMVEALRESLEPGRIYSPAELKEVLRVSRKYLIPFLEFCDRKGVTERRDQGRAVRPAVRRQMNVS
jgi:selenocysteine-specific elongation factor